MRRRDSYSYFNYLLSSSFKDSESPEAGYENFKQDFVILPLGRSVRFSVAGEHVCRRLSTCIYSIIEWANLVVCWAERLCLAWSILSFFYFLFFDDIATTFKM
jgi:hypothetical protein